MDDHAKGMCDTRHTVRIMHNIIADWPIQLIFV